MKRVLLKNQKYDYIFLYLPTFRTGDNKFSFVEYADELKDILKNNILWIQNAHSIDEQNKLCLGINVLLPYIIF